MGIQDLPKLTAISLRQVDFGDQAFAISPDWFPLDTLVDGIRRIGLRCPPHLQVARADTYRVISGFRRLRAASSLGLDVVPCFVLSGNPVQLFVETLVENASSRPLHLLEKATAVWKLTRLFSIPHARVISEFLPLLGIKPNRFEMNRLIDLSLLPRTLQEAMVLGGLEPEIALGLGRWPDDEQSAFLQAFSNLQPGFNLQKELFSLLDELRARDGTPATELLSLARVKADPPSKALNELLRELRARRFPRLAEYERRFQALKAKLALPPEIQFHIPPFFEGDKIQVGFAVRNPKQMREIAAKLGEAAEKTELAEIFELL